MWMLPGTWLWCWVREMSRQMSKQRISKSVLILTRTLCFLIRRDRRGAAIIMEGETADSDAYLVQVRGVVIVLTYLTINIRGSWK